VPSHRTSRHDNTTPTSKAARGSNPRADYRAKGTDPGTGQVSVAKRTLTEFSEDGMTDWAASLTYYGLLALFPAIIAVVSLIGLFGDPAATTKNLTDIVTQLAPGSAAHTLKGPIQSLTANRGGAGIAFIAGLAGALWSASGYIGAFMRATHIIFETPEGRPFWKLRPLQLLVTLVMVVMAALVAVSLVLTGPIVRAVAGPLGIGNAAVNAWNYGKWPVLILVVLAMISLLYYASPNVKLRSFRFVLPGALLALVTWVVASALFALYVANFGSYNKTYGTLAGVVVVLVWVWFTAERERRIELIDGVHEADREIQLEPRDEPKRQKTT
jgi:membrane protein